MIAVWQADFRCWETGHTGTQPCTVTFNSDSWRDFRDWLFRCIIVSLRSAVPLLIALGDTPIFYMVTLAFFSSAKGNRQRIGMVNSWAQVVGGFFTTQ